ncbi:MAG: beta-N-acetylhexosaminidase [Pseudomonadota bacterium]
MIKAFICGCAGTSLSAEEEAFFSGERPWGLILFARNCQEPQQIADLVSAFRQCVGRADAPVLIDQEGGRVQRLKDPHWPAYPSGARIAAAYEADAAAGLVLARNIARLIADDLSALGITVDCLPILDVPQADVHDVIGDRAYGTTPEMISQIGRAMAEGLMERGVLPVIKHIPGHGRAVVDSHHKLPVVSASRQELKEVDFAPFVALADLPLGMTAHIVYPAYDPDYCATQSPMVITEVIRGEIGFDGLLMTDDLSMKALAGDFADRARLSLEAGCDVVLHCNGEMAEMRQVAGAVPALAGEAQRRAERAMACLSAPKGYDRAVALAGLDEVMAKSA